MCAARPNTKRIRPSAETGYDALFFVHGFNSSLEHVLGLLGQMLALGSFPGDIVPVIFAWPCTKGACYPFVRPLLLPLHNCRDIICISTAKPLHYTSTVRSLIDSVSFTHMATNGRREQIASYVNHLGMFGGAANVKLAVGSHFWLCSCVLTCCDCSVRRS